MKLHRLLLIFLLTFSLGLLSACDTAAERAEKHYQSALTFLESGDQERAIVELRNVFRLNGQHREARKTFAELQRDRGNIRDAIGQFLRLVEQYPEDLDGQRALAELNLGVGNWLEGERHADAALALDPNDLPSQAVRVVLNYRTSLEADDDEAIAAAVKAAAGMKEKLPDNLSLRQVIVDDHIKNSNFEAALKELDEAIALQPDNKELVGVRISILSALDDDEGVERQLIEFVERFPDDEAARITLVRWYISKDQLDEAEKFMRAGVNPEDEDNASELALIRFLSELRGRDVAIAELDKVIASGTDLPVFRALRAGLVFDEGKQEEGISEMQEILAVMEPSDEARNIKVALSRMLIATGNNVGARSLVEEVLADDASHVEALKLKANWLIDDDQVGEAIISLRAALDETPGDADIMSLMARAYDREGNQELVGEMLSLAFDASNKAPEETVRYAQYLANREKFVTAESVLIDALRLAPQDVSVLSALGNLYVAMEDWARAEQVAATLERTGDESAITIGQSLKARSLQAQQKTSEAIAYLEELVNSGEAGLGANVEIIRSLLSSGDVEGAKNRIKALAAETPNDPQVRFIEAAVDLATGDAERAEATYRDLLKTEGSQTELWVALFRLLASQGRTDEARTAVEQALSDLPNDLTLQWIYAGIVEKDGDVEKAIEIYQSMYDQDSNNQIIANNLASLLADHRTDEASLDKAFTIARRLRGMDVAPFQDTYGWIAHLRGQSEEAIENLEPAAAGLSSEPMVQFHLAEAYLSADRKKEALDQYLKVVDLTTAADTRPFVEKARAEINRLKGEVESGASE